MRSFGTRKTAAIFTTVAIIAATLITAGASAATIVQAQSNVSFPDPATWALMVLSFALIGAGVRSRKRSVVLA